MPVSPEHVIELPEGFDDFAWEVEIKGWFQGAIAVIAGQRYRVTFYDPSRLAQEIADELEKSSSFFERNLIVVKSVTRAHMQAAIEVIASTGRHLDLVPEVSRPTLSQSLQALLDMMAGGVGQPPTPAEIVITELDVRAIDADGRPRIAVEDLRTPHEYEARFEALMSKGYPWVNLSFYGFLGERGLVVVELPSAELRSPTPSTSINFSGPPAIAAASGWDARSHVDLT